MSQTALNLSFRQLDFRRTSDTFMIRLGLEDRSLVKSIIAQKVAQRDEYQPCEITGTGQAIGLLKVNCNHMKFKTTIFQKGNNLGIDVPETVIEQLGAGKRPPVLVEIKNYSYKSTVGVMEGKFLIPLSSEHRKNVEVAGGETVEVNLDLDSQPRIVALPETLADRLKTNETAKEFFDTLAPSNKKKIVALIETAKTEETLTKRLEKIMADLTQKIRP